MVGARAREWYDRQAKERQKRKPASTVPANLPEQKGDARDQVAKLVGVSGKSIDYARPGATVLLNTPVQQPPFRPPPVGATLETEGAAGVIDPRPRCRLKSPAAGYARGGKPSCSRTRRSAAAFSASRLPDGRGVRGGR